MIWAGCFEELLEVICRMLRLALEIMLGGMHHELLIGVASVLVVISFIATSGDRNLLGLPRKPFLVTSDAPLCSLVGCCGWHPAITAQGRLLVALYENSPECLIARGMPGGNVCNTQPLWA
jgi:hypothetical protein